MTLASLNIDQTKGELPRIGIAYHNSNSYALLDPFTQASFLMSLFLTGLLLISYQPVRITRLAAVPTANCSSRTLLIPLATMSCLSLGRPALSQSRTPSPASQQLILQCAFCRASTPIQNVFAYATTAESVKRTVELLVALATKHGKFHQQFLPSLFISNF